MNRPLRNAGFLFWLVAPFLMGLASEEPMSCKCSQNVSTIHYQPGSGEEEESGGGGIAGSTNYALTRSEMGTGSGIAVAASPTYRTGTELGHFLSQGPTISETYRTYNPLSHEVLNHPPMLGARGDESNAEP